MTSWTPLISAAALFLLEAFYAFKLRQGGDLLAPVLLVLVKNRRSVFVPTRGLDGLSAKLPLSLHTRFAFVSGLNRPPPHSDYRRNCVCRDDQLHDQVNHRLITWPWLNPSVTSGGFERELGGRKRRSH